MESLHCGCERAVLVPILATFFGGTLLKADELGLLSKQEPKSLIGSAKGAQDHERLVRHFDPKASELEAGVGGTAGTGGEYEANPDPSELKMPGGSGYRFSLPHLRLALPQCGEDHE